MHANRIFREVEPRLPQASAPTCSPAAFIMCPGHCLPSLTPEQWMYQQWVYRWAFEQAQAVVRPSLPERDLLAVWN